MSTPSARPKRLTAMKRGETLQFELEYLKDDGTPDDFDASQLLAQVRQEDGTLVATLSIAAGGAPGVFTLSAGDTSAWPIGDAFIDIRREALGVVSFSDTVLLPVQRAESIA